MSNYAYYIHKIGIYTKVNDEILYRTRTYCIRVPAAGSLNALVAFSAKLYYPIKGALMYLIKMKLDATMYEFIMGNYLRTRSYKPFNASSTYLMILPKYWCSTYRRIVYECYIFMTIYRRKFAYSILRTPRNVSNYCNVGAR